MDKRALRMDVGLNPRRFRRSFRASRTYLLALSCTFALAAVGAYAATVPSMVSTPSVARAVADILGAKPYAGESAIQPGAEGTTGAKDAKQAEGTAKQEAAEQAEGTSVQIAGLDGLTAAERTDPAQKDETKPSDGTDADKGTGSGAGTGDSGQSQQKPGGSGGGTSGGAQKPSTPSTPSNGLSAETENAIHAHLVKNANMVNGYVSRINDAVSAFNADQHADLGTRMAHQRQTESLLGELYGRWDDVVNQTQRIGDMNKSEWKDSWGNLTGMYTRLRLYTEVICDAWGINVGYGDEEVAAHTDDYMAPVMADRDASGHSKLMAEFNAYAGGLIL